MGLSASDLSRIEILGRKIASAPDAEAIVQNVYKVVREVVGTSEVRLVAADRPSGWSEWTAGFRVTGARVCDEFPRPDDRGTAAYFDPENPEAGYLWVLSRKSKAEQTLGLVASHAGTAVMLRSLHRQSHRSSTQQKEWMREALRARDEERRHISRELHDDLGQSLASLKLSLKWVEDAARSPQEEMPEAVAELSAARETVGAILGKVRDLSHTLYPAILDSLGFGAAIKELVYQATRHSGMEVEMHIPEEKATLQKETSIALYRCCQEAVHNAVRHSGASRLFVSVFYAAREVRVIVEDDGKGFDPGQIHEAGEHLMTAGFWTIRQRVADLGGAFRVSTALGAGAAIEIIIPTDIRKHDVRVKNKVAGRR